MAAMLAFLKTLGAPLGVWLAAHGLDLAVKAAPLVVLLCLFGVEHFTADRWGMFRFVAAAVSGAVLAMDVAGLLPLRKA